MSLSNNKCCVPGCLESGGSHKSLHRFPHPELDRQRFNTWLYSIGGDILGLTNQDIFNNRRVCHAHFEEKFCCRFNRISRTAVPTLHLPGPLSLPKFTFDESRPARYIQDCSTSKSAEICVQDCSTSKSAETCVSTTERSPLKQIQNLPENPLLMEDTSIIKESKKPTYTQDNANIKIPQCQTVEEKIPRKEVEKNKKKLTKLTAEEGALHKKLVALNMKLNRCHNKIKRQRELLKAAKTITKNPEFLKVTENFTSAAKLLTVMQFRESKKCAKGRRFTDKEKVVALSILKTSPKGYKFLRNIYKQLPSPQTLTKMITRCNIHAGINESIFRQLAKRASKLKHEEDKLCILIFDEMSISANISYNEKKDCINGWVNNGEKKTCEFADHAQVFMIRGLIRNYKQPISYTFASSATKGPELARQIKEIINNVQNAGFTIVATVCDQGTNNVQAIKILVNETKGDLLREGIEPKHNIIIINKQQIMPLFDPPHMLKCLRNNFLEKNVLFYEDNEKKIAKWEHLQKLNELPTYKGIKLISKLTDLHVEKSKIPKMKVKYASQIFSRTVGTNMGFLADQGVLPQDAKNTADLLLLIDNLFDSLNGRYKDKKRHAKPLLGPVTPSSPHHDTWNKAKKIFQKMKFIDNNGKENTIPTIKNWVWTLDNIEVLLKHLKTKYNISSIWTRHLNQDPIEKFFGSIRSHGCRNNNPTAANFESAFTSLLINNMSKFHTPGANCEEDLCSALVHFIQPTEGCEATSSENYGDFHDIHVESVENINDPHILAALHYVSGYFIKKLKQTVFKNCQVCASALIAKEEDPLITYRQYAGKRWLISPSKEFVGTFSEIQDIIHSVINKNLTKSNIKEFIKTIILLFVNFDYLNCVEHKDVLIDKLVNITAKFFLHKFCKKINKILKGVQSADTSNDIEMKAKKYSTKCLKRKK